MYEDIIRRLGYNFEAITLQIGEININYNYYPRISADEKTVERYVNSVLCGEQFPPIVVDKDNNLIDGYHRFLAYKEAGKNEFEVLRILNDLTDEERFLVAVELNLRHGKSFTESDYEKIRNSLRGQRYNNISELFRKYVLVQTAVEELPEEVFDFTKYMEEEPEEEVSPLDKISAILDEKREESDFVVSLTEELVPEKHEETVEIRESDDGVENILSTKEWTEMKEIEEDILSETKEDSLYDDEDEVLKDIQSLKKEDDEDKIRKFMEHFHKIEGMMVKLGKKAVELNISASVFESVWVYLLGHLLSMFRDMFCVYYSQIDYEKTLKVILDFYRILKDDVGFSTENLTVIQGVANSVRIVK